MKAIMRFIKDYQEIILALVTVIATALGITIRPIRGWIGAALQHGITIRVWQIILIAVLISVTGYLIKRIRKKLINKCKFPIGQEVSYKNNITRMIVVKYNPFKDEVLCSWMDSKGQKTDWFSQSTLEEYKDIEYDPRMIRSTRANKFSY